MGRAAAVVVRTLRPALADPAKELRNCAEHLQRDPNDAITYARRGLFLQLLQRPDEAEADLQRSQELYPDAAWFLEWISREINKGLTGLRE